MSSLKKIKNIRQYVFSGRIVSSFASRMHLMDHTIKKQHVKMDIQVQRAAETLNQSNRTCMSSW